MALTIQKMTIESDSFLNENLQGVHLDRCLQPADIGQNVLDLCFDQVFEISPAENNTPVNVLQGNRSQNIPSPFSNRQTYHVRRAK